MEPYLNRSGNSGITDYEIGGDHIELRFRGGKVYRYSYAIAGRDRVEQMKTLAIAGRGLSTYVAQHVHDLYDR
jgi:hypothetical protein